MLDARAGGLDRCAINLWVAQNLTRHPHRFLFDEGKLMPLGDDLAPLVDLLVDVDLHRADTGAAPVERRCERQRAVFAQVERRIDDDTDRPRVSRAIAQAGKRINIARVEQALPKAPRIIATACPYCMVMMSDGIKALEEDAAIATRDIAELVAAAMVIPSLPNAVCERG